MKYAKAYAAFVLTVLTVVVAVLTDNAVDANELASGTATVLQGLFVLFTALGVGWVPNKRGGNTRDRIPSR